MPVKAKYIKDLPLKRVLDGSESLLVQDLNGTQQARLGTIVDEIKQNSQEKIREIESELNQTNAQLSDMKEHCTGGNAAQEHSHVNKKTLDKLSETNDKIHFDAKELLTQDSELDYTKIDRYYGLKQQNELFVKQASYFNGFFTHDTGTYLESGDSHSTGFIGVEPHEEYIVSPKREDKFFSDVAFWDKNKKFIGGITGEYEFKTPSKCAFITVQYPHSHFDTLSINKKEKYFLSNLFDKNDIIYNQFYTHNEGILVDSVDSHSTNFLNVVENKSYFIYPKREDKFFTDIAFWDKDKKFIGGITGEYAFVVPDGVRYVTVQFPVEAINNLVISSNLYEQNGFLAGLKVVNDNLVNHSISEEKLKQDIKGDILDDIVATEELCNINLFNKNDVHKGYTIDGNTGELVKSLTEDSCISGFIDTEPYTVYTKNVYDKDNTWFSYVAHYTDSEDFIWGDFIHNGKIMTPKNAGKMRIQLYNGDLDTMMLVKGVDLPKKYIGYKDYNYHIGNKWHIGNESLELLDKYESHSLNIIGHNMIDNGKYNEHTGVWEYNPECCSTGFIQVPSGAQFISYSTNDTDYSSVCFWDNDKKFIVGATGIDTNGNMGSIPIPEGGVKFVTCTIKKSNLDQLMIIFDKRENMPDKYVPYNPIKYKLSKDIKLDVFNSNELYNSGLQGRFKTTMVSPNGKSFDVTINDDGQIITKKSYYEPSELPADFPKYKFKGKSKYLKEILVGLANYHYVFILDEIGRVKWYKNVGKNGYFLRKQYMDGKPYYTYATTYDDEGGKEKWEMVVLDGDYNEVDRVSMIDENGQPVNIDNHCGLMLGKNHYLLFALNYITVDNVPEGSPVSNGEIAENWIQEIKDGQVIFNWHSSDYPIFYQIFNEGEEYLKDYVHMNSLMIDVDDNIVFSCRHNNSIVKIHRKTGEIMWFLGGVLDEFGLTEKQKWARQHHFRITPEGTYTLFDNVGKRIIELELDQVNKKVLNFKEYYWKNQTARFCGSCQKLSVDDTYLIGWGWLGHDEETEADFGEYDMKNRVANFELKFDNNNNSKDIETYQVSGTDW